MDPSVKSLLYQPRLYDVVFPDSDDTHSLDRGARLLKRTRVWRIPGRPDIEDYAEYRLVYPDALRRLLEAAGFVVAGMFDNRELRVSDLSGTITAEPDVAGLRGRKLYAFALKGDTSC